MDQISQFPPADQCDAVPPREVDGRSGEIRSRHKEAVVGFVMDCHHADELLNVRRADPMAWYVALTLHDDTSSPFIPTSEVRSEVAGAANALNASLAGLRENVADVPLKLSRRTREQVAERADVLQAPLPIALRQLNQ